MLDRIERKTLSRREIMKILKEPPDQLRRLFACGNSKLGSGILTFSTPAVLTCPGRTELCERLCYAQRGHFAWPSTQRHQAYNLVVTCRDDFVDVAVDQLKARTERVVRVHASGDLYDDHYAEKWLEIMTTVRNKRFFLYTRSWRIPEIRAVLLEMTHRPNVRIWFSTDQETGGPGKIPSRTRVAYMQTTPADRTGHHVDLVFRDYPLRKRTEKFSSNGSLVCPSENGASHLTCQDCRLCWGPLAGTLDPRNHRRQA